jgi:hypothetical protein
MLMRYAMLVALAASAVWAAVNLSTGSSQAYLVDAAQGAEAANASFWLLAGIASLIMLSLCRFVIFGLPSMVDDWYRDNKSWLYLAIIGGLLYGVFYLM